MFPRLILDRMALPHRDAELLQIMDAAFVDAAARSGPWLLCRTGCTQCCHGAFAINALDAMRLEKGMDDLRTNNPSLAGQIEHRTHAWLEQYGSDFPGDLATGTLGQSDEEVQLFESFADDAPCPALNPSTGLCDVYAWRPMTCRVFGPPVRMGEGDSLGHCELCFHGATETEVAACEMALPHELENSVVEELGDSRETLVAFALLRSSLPGKPSDSPR
jgi:Fe-S-cluster containining protein